MLRTHAYDFRHCRETLRRRGIKGRIARRGKEASERLGRHRWVVERTLAWLARYRRLAIRYERLADMHEAFLHLVAIVEQYTYPAQAACSLNYLSLEGFAMHSKANRSRIR